MSRSAESGNYRTQLHTTLSVEVNDVNACSGHMFQCSARCSRCMPFRAVPWTVLEGPGQPTVCMHVSTCGSCQQSLRMNA